jgi:hypothetical protein
MHRLLRMKAKAIVPLIAAGMLTLHLSAKAQDFAETIRNQFTLFSNKALTEKLYVHTDKNIYLAGEILWLKVYYVDGVHNKPLDLSKVAYVELLDRENKPVMQGKVALKNGGGSGSLYIPSSVSAGNYTLRAYTHWMKNFGADYFFEQPVSIINSLKPLPSPVIDSNRLVAQFFPEGGNLVNGLNSKVAFQITDQYGKGVACTGILTNQRNETILSFQPTKFGMGSFSFTPVAGDSYTATIRSAQDQSTNAALPRAYEQGYVMQLQEATNGALTVTINSNVPFSSQPLFLLIQSHQLLKAGEKKVMTNGTISFTIDKNNLEEGISQFTVFNEQRQPLCERLYFKYPQKALGITASPNAQEYDPRTRVDLSVGTNAAAKAAAANLSLSVYRLDALPRQGQPDIFSYLWLNSDLKGSVESPEYYFSARTPEVTAAMDHLMMVHGWRRFNWEDVLKNNTGSFAYVPEFDGHIITGKITTANTEAPVPKERVYLAIAGTKLQFYPVLSSPQGDLRFDVRNYYGPGEVILQTEDSTNHIDIYSPYSEKYTQKNREALILSPELERTIAEDNIGMQVQNAYYSDRMTQFEVPLMDTTPFYGNSAKQYLLDDYVRFTTTEEVLREYVPDVAVRKSDGHFKLYVFNWETETHYKSGPLVLLDGVPVSVDKIMGYDPLKMRKLQVLTDRYVSGEFTFDGVISFTTYHGDLTDLRLDTKALIMDYDGLQMKREFYAPVYETAEQKASRLPDFRNQLYWSPDVQTDSHGKANIHFFTSDLKGKYVAVLQGMDNDGNSGSYSFTFEVK